MTVPLEDKHTNINDFDDVPLIYTISNEMHMKPHCWLNSSLHSIMYELLCLHLRKLIIYCMKNLFINLNNFMYIYIYFLWEQNPKQWNHIDVKKISNARYILFSLCIPV